MASSEDMEQLMRLLNGYRATCLIVASVRLGLIDQLGTELASEETLARSLKAHLPSLQRFLRGLEALGLVQRETSGVGLTAMGKLLLRNFSAMADRAVLTGEEYISAWDALHHTVLTGETAFENVFGVSAWEHRRQHPELNECFNRIMADDQHHTERAIVAAYDFAGSNLIIDVGGGHGHLLAEILAEHPNCSGIVFDQPHVIEHATKTLDSVGARNRCRAMAGSFFDSIPTGGDVYLLQHILHDWDDEHCGRILSNCRSAMKSGSKLLVIENLMLQDAPPTEKLAMLDLHMMAVLDGRERTRSEYEALLTSAGLSPTRCVETSAHTAIIEAIPSPMA